MVEGMSFEQAAGISTTYGTSYYALKQRAALATRRNACWSPVPAAGLGWQR